MDTERIFKVVEETDRERVNAYLKTGRWIRLAVAPGRTEGGEPYCLYSLGWLGAASEDDTSEFPEMPEPEESEREEWT